MSPTMYICCFLPLFMCLFLWLEYERKRGIKRRIRIRKAKNRRKKSLLPEEIAMISMMNELIGKDCTVTVDGASFKGKTEAFEENWIKLRIEDGSVKLINTDYVSNISFGSIKPEKIKKVKEKKQKKAGK